MAFINLKQTKEEIKENMKDKVECCPTQPSINNEPQYPWGTRITFEKGSLGKLGLDIAALTVGDRIQGGVILEVVGVRQTKRTGGDDEESLELQVTDLDLGDNMPIGRPAIEKKISAYKALRDEGPTQEY